LLTFKELDNCDSDDEDSDGYERSLGSPMSNKSQFKCMTIDQ